MQYVSKRRRLLSVYGASTYLRGIVEKAMNDGDSTVTCSIAFLLTIADKFERLAAEHYTLLCAQAQNESLTCDGCAYQGCGYPMNEHYCGACKRSPEFPDLYKPKHEEGEGT